MRVARKELQEWEEKVRRQRNETGEQRAPRLTRALMEPRLKSSKPYFGELCRKCLGVEISRAKQGGL